MSSNDQIIVALDTPCIDMAERLLKELQGVISFYKVGFELFTAHGWAAVKLVRKYKGRVFLDLKLHDIPNTVSKTMAVLCEHEVDMVTVHTLGGFEMMKKTCEIADARAATGKHRPMILGVTILTSHSEEQIQNELGIQRKLPDQVLALAKLAHRAGLDGIVSSPQETAILRAELPKEFLMVTPGVRPEGAEHSDQKRTFTPAKAIESGASYLVVGRPITSAENPREAAELIVNSINAPSK